MKSLTMLSLLFSFFMFTSCAALNSGSTKDCCAEKEQHSCCTDKNSYCQMKGECKADKSCCKDKCGSCDGKNSCSTGKCAKKSDCKDGSCDLKKKDCKKCATACKDGSCDLKKKDCKKCKKS